MGAGALKVWSVKILKPGLEASDTETYRGYTATSGLRHQNESNVRRKAVKVKLAIERGGN